MKKPKLSDQVPRTDFFSELESSNKKNVTSWVTISFCAIFTLLAGYAYLFFSDTENIQTLIKAIKGQKSVMTSVPKLKWPHHKREVTETSNKRPQIHAEKKKEKIYSWIDEKGIKQFSNVQPDSDVTNLEITEGIVRHKNSLIIKDNRVLIPVILSYNGKIGSTFLVLDTGASVTSIHDDFAMQFEPIQYGKSYATVADGRSVPTKTTKFDYIKVGPYKMDNIRVDIIPYEKQSNVDKGLLGMNFLRHFKYQVDYQKKTILWL